MRFQGRRAPPPPTHIVDKLDFYLVIFIFSIILFVRVLGLENFKFWEIRCDTMQIGSNIIHVN